MKNYRAIKLSLNKPLLIFLALNAWLVCSFYLPAQAQTNIASTQKIKVTFNPPGKKQPKNTTGAASRNLNQCGNRPLNSVPFTPLLADGVLGLTVASHPTVLAYLPESSARKVFLSWQDENNENIYQAIIPINGKAGIYRLTLDQKAPALQIGKTYSWTLAMMCDNKLKPDSPIVQGQIERVELKSDLVQKLQNVSPLEKASLYGQAGIWYEAVATLAQLKTANVNERDLGLSWKEFLTSVGLEKLVEMPLIESEFVTK